MNDAANTDELNNTIEINDKALLLNFYCKAELTICPTFIITIAAVNNIDSELLEVSSLL